MAFLLLIFVMLKHVNSHLHILQHVDVISPAKRIKSFFPFLKKSSSTTSIQHIQLRQAPSDAMYNYKEFQQPLVALDKY